MCDVTVHCLTSHSPYLQLKEFQLSLTLMGRNGTQAKQARSASCQPKFCTVVNGNQSAVVVLENPVGSGNIISHGCLLQVVRPTGNLLIYTSYSLRLLTELFHLQVRWLFSLQTLPKLYSNGSQLSVTQSTLDLHGCTLSVGTTPSSSATPIGATMYVSDNKRVVAVANISSSQLSERAALNTEVSTHTVCFIGHLLLYI